MDANRQRRLIRSISLGGLAALAAGVGAYIMTANLDSSAAVAGITSLFAGLASLALDIAGRLGPSAQSSTTAGNLADDLAVTVRDQWLDEAWARRLRDPQVLPLSWSASGRDVGDSLGSVLGSTAVGRIVQLRLDGRIDGNFDQVTTRLAQDYRQIPSGRLLVLGEPGSGKSVLALLLTLGLLTERAEGTPVPVLLAASSWDPVVEDLDDWIVRTLATSYYNGRTELPRRLLSHDLLLPVLDGLDEIPESARRSAVRAINRAVGQYRPVVVTCRAAEYEDVIRGGAPVLRRAPVVEIAPVAAADVIEYLRAIDWPTGVVWDRVYQELAHQPTAPVTETLSSPLMVSLARQVYQRLTVDPAELIDQSRFDCRHAVEDYLIDQVVDSAYPVGGSVSSAQARRWLTYLANYLHRYRERDIAWWLFSRRLLSPWFAPGIGIATGVLFMLAISVWITVLDTGRTVGLNVALTAGAGASVGLAVLTTLVWYAGADRPPGRLSFAIRGSAVRLRQGFATGLAVIAVPGVPVLGVMAIAISAITTWSVANVELYVVSLSGTAAGAVVIGLTLAARRWLEATPERSAQASPQRFIRDDRRSCLIGALAAGIVASATTLPGLIAGMSIGSLASQALAGWPGWPGNPDPASVGDARRYDVTERYFAATPMMVGALIVLPGLGVALLVLLTGAWARFAVARAMLATRGALPWRLLRFLADARDRELLRQVGGTYQFRHIRLQERLAAESLGRRGRTAATADGGDARQPAPIRRRRVAVATVVATLLAAVPLTHLPHNGSTVTLPGRYGIGAYGVTFAADGSLLVTNNISDKMVGLYTMPDGHPLQPLGPFPGGVSMVAISRDGRTIAVRAGVGSDTEDDDDRVWIVDLASRRNRSFKVIGDVSTLAFDPTDRTVLAQLDGQEIDDGTVGPVLLWDAVSQRPLRTFTPTEGFIDTELSTDRRTVLTNDGGRRRQLWDTADGESFYEHGDVDEIYFSADQRAVVARPGSIQVLNTTTHALLTTISGDFDDDFDGTDAFASKTPDGLITVWNPVTARPLLRLTPGPSQTTQLSPNGATLALIGPPNTVRLWNVADSHELPAIAPFQGDIDGIEFSPTGDTIIIESGSQTDTTADDQTRWLRASTGTELTRGGNEFIDRRFSPDGATVVTHTENGLRLWRAADGRPVADLGRLPNGTAEVDFSPDGTTLVVVDRSSDRSMQTLYRTGDGTQLRRSATAYDGTEHIIYSPIRANPLLASIDTDDQVRLVNFRTGEVRRTCIGHSGPIETATFNPAGDLLATTGRDGTVRLWRVPQA